MDYRSSELEHATRERIALLADVWASRENGADEEAGGPAAVPLTKGADNKKKPSCRDLASAAAVVAHKRGGWLSNLKYLTWRATNSAYRNVFSITLRIFLNVVFALIFSAIWSDVKHDQTGIQSLVGLIFMVSTNVAFANTQAVINIFPIEAGIIRKEQASNSYSLSAYFLSKFISELPLNLFGPCIFATLVFWLTGFEHSLEHYGIFLAIVCLASLSAIGTGTFISTLAPNVEVAGALSPVFNVLFLIFSGILINTNSLPAGAKWVPSISPIKWTVNALALNEFTDATFSCTPGQRCLAVSFGCICVYMCVTSWLYLYL
jgi:ABC-type multidrug transport system permease subunit